MLEKHERHTTNDRIHRQVHTSTNMKKYKWRSVRSSLHIIWWRHPSLTLTTQATFVLSTLTVEDRKRATVPPLPPALFLALSKLWWLQYRCQASTLLMKMKTSWLTKTSGKPRCIGVSGLGKRTMAERLNCTESPLRQHRWQDVLIDIRIVWLWWQRP